MNTKTREFLLILVLIVVTISLMISVATAKDHSTTVCYNCHSESFSDEEGSCTENCHNIKDNIEGLEKMHSRICSKCHAIPQNTEEYHKLHSSVSSCEKCHGNGTLPIRPTVGITNCAGCHGASVSFTDGGNIHEAHAAKLDVACPKCHGTRPGSSPSSSSPTALSKSGISPKQDPIKDIASMIYAKTIDYRKYTLYEMFEKFFSLF